MSDTLTLERLHRQITKKESKTFDMDMSRFFEGVPEEELPILFHYKPLGIDQLFALAEKAEIIKRQEDKWSDKQCQEIAAICACHVSPPCEFPATLQLFYVDLFRKADDFELVRFIQEFGEKAGEVFSKGLRAAVEAQKKTSEQTETA
jgi:hypothetical protein